MGASLAMAAYANRPNLSHSAFRLLVHMALTCKDSDDSPTYWAGREGMAIALGVPNDERGYQAIKRALKQLIDAGAIERVTLGANGRRSEYRLWINPRREPVEGIFRGSKNEPLRGSKNEPLRGSKSEPLRGSKNDPPRNN